MNDELARWERQNAKRIGEPVRIKEDELARWERNVKMMGKPFYWLKDLTTEVYPHNQVFLSADEISHDLYSYITTVLDKAGGKKIKFAPTEPGPPKNFIKYLKDGPGQMFLDDLYAKRSISDFDKQAIRCQIKILDSAVRQGGKISVAEYAKLWPEWGSPLPSFDSDENKN